jgi:adenine-specific DNA-methyltransferase
MAKMDLTEEDLARLLEAVNSGAEPPPELAARLFPSLMEKLGQAGKFDFETLNRIRIPTIEYAGKRSEGVILASAVALGQSAPLQLVRSFGEPGEDGWKNLVVQGDNLQFLKTIYLNQDPLIRDKVKGKVKLIYIDPPFATKSDFQGGEGARSYSDKIESAEFIENLRERLVFLRELLTEDGSIYLHLDTKKSHYLKLVMDEIFGETNFVNEVIWQRTASHNDPGRYGNVHDTILFYRRGHSYRWNAPKMEQSQDYIDKFFVYAESPDKFRWVKLKKGENAPDVAFRQRCVTGGGR